MEEGSLSISRILFLGHGGIQTLSLFVGWKVLIVLAALCFLYWLCVSSGRPPKEERQIPRFPKATPPVFPNGWIPVMESADLGAGDVKSVNAFGTFHRDWRSRWGDAHAAMPEIPEMQKSAGLGRRFFPQCAPCGLFGRRIGMAKADEHEMIHAVNYLLVLPEFAKMKTWRSEEILGLVFVWYHAEREQPSWLLTDVPEITNRKWGRVGKRNQNIIHCHIQELAENAADIGHFDHLHGPSCLVTGEKFNVDSESSWWGRLMYHRWETAWSPRGHLGSVHVVCKTFSSLDWLKKLQRYEFELVQVGPALVVTIMKTQFGNVGYVLSITPEKPFQLRAVHRYYPDPGMPRLFFLFLVWASKYMVSLGF
ncbi:unnamed protein product [Ixodes hexagonus]